MKRLIVIFILNILVPAAALAQGTGFNFQGRLNDGTNPANGRFDLQLRLYDAVAGGNPVGAAFFHARTRYWSTEVFEARRSISAL